MKTCWMPSRWRRKSADGGGFIWRHLLAVTTALLVALLMIVVLWPYVVITVPSGRVGVYWKRIQQF